jgi:hypothetical protein
LGTRLYEVEQELRKIKWRLDFVIAAAGVLLIQGGKNMAALDDLKAQVAANTAVETSAVTLIQGIAQQLKDAIAAGDPVALTALADQLHTSAASLADAITANTPTTP